jgi:hypothetical protein
MVRDLQNERNGVLGWNQAEVARDRAHGMAQPASEVRQRIEGDDADGGSPLHGRLEESYDGDGSLPATGRGDDGQRTRGSRAAARRISLAMLSANR